MKYLYAVFVYLYATFAAAAGGIPLLMDAHSTGYVTDLAQPLLKAANIPQSKVRFFITADNTINAFVTPNNNMYINAGLILKAESAEQLIGVMAHELGHIQGQHLIAMQIDADKMRLPAIISGVLGIGAVVAGAPDAGSALIIGGQAASVGQFLHYTRSHERDADQRAFKILTSAGYSAEPFAKFFDVLKGQELLYSQRAPEYLQTHPYNQSRKDAANAYISTVEPAALTQPRQPNQQEFKLVKARLFAAMNTPMQTVRKYGGYSQENSLEGSYAVAVAYAISGAFEKATPLAKNLLEQKPNHPYFLELMAYILSETGKIDAAIPYFQQAVDLVPSNGLLRIQLAQFLNAQGNYQQALPHLLRITHEQPEWPMAWHLLGVTYGKLGQLAHSHIALAEEALQKDKPDDAKLHLHIAEKELEKADDNVLRQQIANIRATLDK